MPGINPEEIQKALAMGASLQAIAEDRNLPIRYLIAVMTQKRIADLAKEDNERIASEDLDDLDEDLDDIDDEDPDELVDEADEPDSLDEIED